MDAKRFIVVLLALIVSFVTGAGLLNVLVDPYDIFGMPRRTAFNATKPNADTHTAMVKTFQIERVVPHAALFGTSRVDIGIDPDNPAWPQAARPVYNYGYPATSLPLITDQLRHAAQAGPLRLALVGLEFNDFLSPQLAPEGEPNEIERRLRVMAGAQSDNARRKQIIVDSASATLTLKAVLDSVDTVLRQGRPSLNNVSEHGLTSENLFARFAQSDGYNDPFTKTALSMIRGQYRAARGLSGTPPTEFAELAYVRSIIEFCKDRNIELYLVIPPYHADFLEIVDAAGLWDRFENWKVALVKLVEEYGGSDHSPRIVLWDFASYDRYTTEVVPPKGDHQSTLNWFWEPAHFKKALGDIMLSRMLLEDEQKFGVILTSRSIAARLADGRANRETYRAANPQEVERIATLIRSVKQVDARNVATTRVPSKRDSR